MYHASPFSRFAKWTAHATGHPASFALAVGIILLWAATGPVFGFSDTWQLVINTGTTIVTFLMVFLIQNTQNRDARAIHLKLDELLRGVEGARTGLVDLEDFSDEELAGLQEEFQRLSRHGNTGVQRHGRQAAGVVEHEQRRRKAARSKGR